MAGQETTGNRDGNFARCRDGDTKLKTASGTAVQAFTNGIDRAMNQNSLVKRSIVFFLVPNFSMIAFATAIEPLRIANRMLGYDAYQWRLTSVDGKPVTASNGVECAVNASLEDERRYLQREQRPSMVFVCSGVHVEEFRNKSVFAWLREEYNRGVAVGGLCTGAHILAAAGLLSGRRCAIHWENLPGFSEAFPKAEVYADLFEVDSNLYTCAGGTASLDMMLKLIGDDFDANLVNKICEQALTDRVRSPQDRQRLPLRARLGIQNSKVLTIIEMMEANLSEPQALINVAHTIGLSRRQVERLFRQEMGRSPARYYLEIRLDRARHLLLQSSMPVVEVAVACGFVSASHFSKCYRELYGRSPQQERAERKILVVA
ncbi:Transcriptional regulator containing an amidase domain and an AraC-type DNA-binding HTH domain [Brucella suis bv. 2]|nr:ARAC family Transcriptional regulator [Brucella canis HSK A52141]AIB18055.1 Transcriptional regulator containing an amidase domain and an AraC-type DNA-binding HTH domain [Brucella suis bv. 2]AIB20488.1 Transcriptional regulator containing an amidase domain and an AraC-type DNA-binding HTH domain [Brucella suis bv. 2]AIB27245.1 Transcriptional regulator containing an amidase domain and an AraC-type DNA-binding HTH domain [Brucella suis bv. 2]AIB31556.1 Transcriptional regulator containing an